ncbi:MAG TPA: AI-2E family transporter, partial [Thermomicrobiales bacterium]|nr:AI-2E family transporter [Thermomicrobiales bacterium]
FGWSNATLAIVIAATYFALRQLEDAFVIPLVIGRIVHLHPLLVIFVLVIGTTLGGPLGLILAVPIAAVIKILAAFFYEKIRAREHRHIEVIRSRADLERARERFPDLMNATVVLLIEGEALTWADLEVMTAVADAGLDHAINLTVVTLDGVAGALAAAAGIKETTIPLRTNRFDDDFSDVAPNLVTAD